MTQSICLWQIHKRRALWAINVNSCWPKGHQHRLPADQSLAPFGRFLPGNPSGLVKSNFISLYPIGRFPLVQIQEIGLFYYPVKIQYLVYFCFLASFFFISLSLFFSVGSCLVYFPLLLLGFKLVAGALASLAFVGVAIGAGLIQASLVISIGRNPSKRDELLRYAFIGFSLVEVSGLIGLVMSFLLLFGFYLARNTIINIFISQVLVEDNHRTETRTAPSTKIIARIYII